MRVIGGKYRSRPLKAVPGNKTRPTTDKVKESMFNLLTVYLPVGGRCLDFYAGSGALAIEAVSRGLDQAVLCELQGQAIKVIQENIAMTKEADRFSVLKGKNRQTLQAWAQQNPDQTFDLIFLDPPYAKSQLEEDIKWLSQAGLISLNGLIMVESDSDHLLDTLEAFELLKHKQYGLSHLQLLGYRGGKIK